ncbi:putative glucosylceramidase 3 [Plodia interpunctella]|uniref:putative glucosylceramidase 3 n=1 Tax=Plodia interpunctella TaxID=58824 RepID=UPI0023676397|nr:putative glucosylceramidase 3 [Plodia interpunctella]
MIELRGSVVETTTDHKMPYYRFIVKLTTIFFIGFTSDFTAGQQDRPCEPRKFGESVVCVCNSTYCDDVIRLPPEPGTYVSYTSSLAGLRFKKDKGTLEQVDEDTSMFEFAGIKDKLTEPKIELDCAKKYQKIEGFGGSVTDSAAINWMNLKEPCLKENLINSFFGKNGLEYNMIRTPIGGSDFSTREYSYNEIPENDTLLRNFTLAIEDFDSKIPMMKEAIAAATDEIHIVSSVWSPPVWMKNSHEYSGFSLLIEEYFQTYAEYYVKYIEAYAAENITIWGITTGNEPLTSVMGGRFNSLGWTTELMGKWISQNLGPTIRKSKYRNVKILAVDDQRPTILIWFNKMVQEHPEAEKYIDGIAVHWYLDKITPPSILKHTAETYPDKFLIGTEACSGANPTDVMKVALGSWKRAVDYAKDIIEDLQNEPSNLCLDSQGGPNWAKNYVDATVIVFHEDEEFVKQPMYYAMGHFAKFLPRNSVRIDATNTGLIGIDYVAFETPGKTYVVVLYNGALDQTVKIRIDGREAIVELPAESIVTVELNSI